MKRIFFIALLVFIPGIVYGFEAKDFKINSQSVYTVPYGVSKVLILDLTLPEPSPGETLQVESIKIHSFGTVDHTVISKLEIWQDGNSVSWDNDETEVARVLQPPFFDNKISGNFKPYSKTDPWRRIFITIDLKPDFVNEKILKLQVLENSVVFINGIVGPTDEAINGLERTIHSNASIPTVPMGPIAKTSQVLSFNTIRWYFTDSSNNEFGFRIMDANLNIVAQKDEANLSYLDETGLQPDTEYSGRKIVAFNDRGESLSSSLAVFSPIKTLVEEKIEEPTKEEVVKEIVEENIIEEIKVEPSLFKTIQTKIAEIQQEIDKLLEQLSELINQQTATVWIALQRFLSSFFGK